MQNEILLAGFAGGIIRGLNGYLKYFMSYKGVKFDINYFAFVVLISGLVGVMVGYAFDDNFLVALIAGYAGGDFLENVYKLVAKRTDMIDLGE